MRDRIALPVALCGLLGALAVVIMLLGGMVPLATYCCPVLAAALMVPVLRECSLRLALAWYAAVAILSCLLGPDKEAAALYLFLGWYPAAKPWLDRQRPLIRIGGKLAVFNAAIAAMYALLLFVLHAEALRAELLGMRSAMLVVCAALGNVTFLLFDALLPRIERIYVLRLRPHLRR